MLRLRPARRSAPGCRGAGERRFDIHDGSRAIGQLTYDRRYSRGAFNIGEDGFVLECAADGPQGPAQPPPAMRKPSSPVFSLKTAPGALLARAERDRGVYVVGMAGESYLLQAGRSRLYFHLQREGDVVMLGGVGQRRFWTSCLEIDLPGGFSAAFQVFLASLLLDLPRSVPPD